MDDLTRVISEIRSRQSLRKGNCARCYKPTGTIAPAYAKLEIAVDGVGFTMHIPLCESCIENYREMIRETLRAMV